jgi:hypothetical protein
VQRGNVKLDISLPPPAFGWKVLGVGDFDDDAKADILWRRQVDTVRLEFGPSMELAMTR